MSRRDGVIDWGATDVDPFSGPGKGPPCLIELVGSTFGHRHILELPVIIGREATVADIVVADTRASRRHCRLYRYKKWVFIKDLNSTNGTYVNKRQVRRQALEDGDLVQVGDTLFQFARGEQSTRDGHVRALRSARLDEVTELPRERAFVLRVDELVTTRSPEMTSFSVFIVAITDFRKFVDALSAEDIDHILREVGRALVSHVNASSSMVGRLGGGDFAVLVRNLDAASAASMASGLVGAVRSLRVQADQRTLHLAARTGCRTVDRGSDALDAARVLKEARDALANTGRDAGAVVPQQIGAEEGQTLVVKRREYDGELLIKQAAASHEAHACLCATIVDADRALADAGRAVYDARLRELVDIAHSWTQQSDLVGRWMDRYVLLAPHGERAARVDELAASVKAAWMALPPAPGASPRRLEIAWVTADELKRFGVGTLDELVRRARASGGDRRVRGDAPGRLERLPSPLVAALWEAQRAESVHGAVKWLIDGLETALAFGAAVLLAELRDRGPPQTITSLGRFLAKKSGPCSAGKWRDILCQAACDDALRDTWLAAVTSNVVDRTGQRTQFMSRVNEAIELRNRRFVHGRGLPSESEAEAMVPTLRGTYEDLVAHWIVFAESTLVGVTDIRRAPNLDDGIEAGTYRVIVARGPTDANVTVEERDIGASLQRGHTYLLPAAGAPLMLDPWFAVAVCDACRRKTVFVARKLVFGPVGAKVRQQGVVCGHERDGIVPSGKRAKALADAVSGRGGA